jgi:hypothetical protein
MIFLSQKYLKGPPPEHTNGPLKRSPRGSGGLSFAFANRLARGRRLIVPRATPGRRASRSRERTRLLEATGAGRGDAGLRGRDVREDARANVLPELRERSFRDARLGRDIAPLRSPSPELRDAPREGDPLGGRAAPLARRGGGGRLRGALRAGVGATVRGRVLRGRGLRAVGGRVRGRGRGLRGALRARGLRGRRLRRGGLRGTAGGTGLGNRSALLGLRGSRSGDSGGRSPSLPRSRSLTGTKVRMQTEFGRFGRVRVSERTARRRARFTYVRSRERAFDKTQRAGPFRRVRERVRTP